MNAANSGLNLGMEAPAEIYETVQKIEEALRRRVAIGTKISHSRIHEEMSGRFNNVKAVDFVLSSFLT